MRRCLDCDKPMAANRNSPDSGQAEVFHRARDLCEKCYGKALRNSPRCSRCKAFMVTAWQWRQGIRKPGHVLGHTLDRCRSCYDSAHSGSEPRRKIPNRCVTCRVKIIPRARWQAGERPEGARMHRGYGKCSACYQRWYALKQKRRPQRPLEEVLEDWDIIRDFVSNLEQGAAQLGMTPTALERALFRGRQKGDDRAKMPIEMHATAYSKRRAKKKEKP